MLSYKDNQRCFGNPGDPRIADELRIERKQARRRFRVSAGCRLPVDEAAHPINFTDRVEVGNELAAARKPAKLLYLEILMRVGNSDAIVLSKPFEQMDSLVQQAIPSLALPVIKSRIAIGRPLTKQRCSAVFLPEINSQSGLKTAAESQGRASFFF